MKIAVFGAGGMGREVACLIQEINAAGTAEPWQFVGFYDDNPTLKSVPQGAILGNLEALNAVVEPLAVVLALGTPKALRAVREHLTNPLLSFPNLISPRAHFIERESVKMGCGNVIQPGIEISFEVNLGDFNICNVSMTLGHEAKIGSYNVFLMGTRLAGNVEIGNNNLFGTNSFVHQGVKIGDNVTIGACSAVLHSTQNNATYLGVPAKILKL